MEPNPTAISEQPKRSGAQQLFLVLTYVISIACLVWVLHDIDTASLRDEVAAMDWWWVTIAVITDILVYFWQGWRWSLLLKPLADIPFWRSVRAIYVGLFANEILPLRTGEIIRCYLLGRWSKLPFSVVLSSALIERIFDGLWLVVCLLVTMQFVDLPQFLVDGGMVLALFILAGIALLGAALFFKDQARRAFSRSRLLSKLNIVIEDLNIIGHSRYVYFSAFASLPYLLMQIVPIYALIRAYGQFDLSLAQAAAIMVILRLGSVVPQAPGNLGAFQALTIIGLGLFGVELGLAKRFSIVMWSVITLPLLVAGFVALAITGIRMAELRRQASQASIQQQQPRFES